MLVLDGHGWLRLVHAASTFNQSINRPIDLNRRLIMSSYWLFMILFSIVLMNYVVGRCVDKPGGTDEAINTHIRADAEGGKAGEGHGHADSRPAPGPRPRLPLARGALSGYAIRKLYHALAVAMFIPATITQPWMMRLSYGVAIAVFLVLEVRVAS